MADMGPPEDSTSMDEVLNAVRDAAFPNGALCTGWVTVSEWVDAEGNYWVYTTHDQNNPPWRHTGLLAWSLDMGMVEFADDDDDDDDDE